MSAKAANGTINVLDLRDAPWVDGPGRTILDCAHSLEGNDYHFVIGTFGNGHIGDNDYANEAQRRGLQVEMMPAKKSFDSNTIRRILDIIDKNQIDILHTHDFRTDVYGLLAARKRKIPVVSTVHGWIGNDLKGKVYGLLDKILLHFFDHIISVSERTRKKLLRALIPASKTSVIDNALILDGYVIDRSNNKLREELGRGDDAILIANIGRLSPEKGQLEFLKAGLGVYKDHPEIVLVLVGIGPDEEMLRNFVRSHNMQDYVAFCGFRKDMIDVYNNLDLVVQSSYTEGMPNVVLESLLMEVPVIATDVGGTAEIITPDETGILVQPGNTEELVSRIKEFITHPGKHSKMASAGGELIREKFDHEKRVIKLKSLYETIVRDKGR